MEHPAYRLGYNDGYNDKDKNNPYDYERSFDDWSSYEDGYYDGLTDSENA